MQSLSDIRRMLESRGLTPRRAFGQNFLTDHNLIRKLVDASGVGPGDTVLEVGPGTGTMTEEVLARGCRVVAAEIDRGLCVLLREHFEKFGDRFTLVEGDCLESKRAFTPALLAALGGGPFRLVSNLPYSAATPIIGTLLASHPECSGLFVTIQREVADRLAAAPGSDDYGALSVLAQAAAAVSVIAMLPPECFWPRPEVHSAMVAITRLPAPLTPHVGALGEFAQRLFEKRRKQLGSVLGRDLRWPAGVQSTDRAETLTVPQIIELFDQCRAREDSEEPRGQ
jgi:16S rRNA (adenine1518-N6/adenine1519-N6)-dimethyltransferase